MRTGLGVLLLALLLLALLVAAGVTVGAPLVRQDALDSHLLQAVQDDAGAPVVAGLIRQGADPNAGDAQGYDTALFQALARPDPDTVRVLLRAGAIVGPRGPAHTSAAIALACSLGDGSTPVAVYRALFTELRGHGADLEGRDSLGDTPLMRAVWSGNPAATQALLELGADPRAVNNLGQTVASWTGRNGEAEGTALDALLGRYLKDRPRPAGPAQAPVP